MKLRDETRANDDGNSRMTERAFEYPGLKVQYYCEIMRPSSIVDESSEKNVLS
jgi:hypothetical protein